MKKFDTWVTVTISVEIEADTAEDATNILFDKLFTKQGVLAKAVYEIHDGGSDEI